MSFTAQEWQDQLAAIGVKKHTAAAWAPAFADEVRLERFSKGMDDLLVWLPQILHESMMLERVEESLTYSPERIHAVWPSRFPTIASAIPYSMSPRKLANKVYGGRMGNKQPDDGWKYRGRGPIMATGQDAYELLSRICGQDYDVMPELLLQPRFGLEASLLWWEDRVPDSMLSDQVKLRRRVNGGSIGLEHCLSLHEKTVSAFA